MKESLITEDVNHCIGLNLYKYILWILSTLLLILNPFTFILDWSICFHLLMIITNGLTHSQLIRFKYFSKSFKNQFTPFWLIILGLLVIGYHTHRIRWRTLDWGKHKDSWHVMVINKWAYGEWSRRWSLTS